MAKILYLEEKGSEVGPSAFSGHEVLCAKSVEEATELIEQNRESIDAFVLGLVVYETKEHKLYYLTEGVKVYDLIDEIGLVGKKPIIFYSLMAERFRPKMLYETPERPYNPQTPKEDLYLNWFCWDRNDQKVLENPKQKIHALDSFAKPWEIVRLLNAMI